MEWPACWPVGGIMRKIALLAALALAPVLFAQGSPAIHNVCDSLSLGTHSMVDLVPAYFDEFNWYVNPSTGTTDSSFHKRHAKVDSLTMLVSSGTTLQIPTSIKATCHETLGTEVGFTTWNSNQKWVAETVDDYATSIYDIRQMKTNGHDSTNTFNVLAFVPEKIPEDNSFTSDQLLYSVSFEFAFEWWFAGASFKHYYTKTGDEPGTIRSTTRYAYSTGNDSLKVYNNAVERLDAPDSAKSIHVQMVKAVLVDSRKPLPISSGDTSSSSSEGKSSSSQSPVSCSAQNSSSSVSSSSVSSSSVSSSSVSSSSVSSSSVSSSSVSSSSQGESSSSEIHNICDTLFSDGNQLVELVPAYIDETNWYGNVHTGNADSVKTVRHASYEALKISGSSFPYELPLSVKAACREALNTVYKYATWDTAKAWVEKTNDNYATYIYDARKLSIGVPGSQDIYNMLAFVPEKIPENGAYKSNELLFSKTYEFAFEWWYANASFTTSRRGTGADSSSIYTQNHFLSVVGNDSLKSFESVINGLGVPDTAKSVHVQVVKVVLVDSRKAPEITSSSSSVNSSSSAKSSSSEGKSSSSSAKSSSSEGKSSSSVKSSSSEGKSSASEESSSSGKSSSSVESSSSAKSSSSKKETSSSSEKSERIFAMENQDASRYVVQVRRLDGSVVGNMRNLEPGVYYVRYSDGKWQKKAVLLK